MNPIFLRLLAVSAVLMVVISSLPAAQAGARGGYFGGVPDLSAPTDFGVMLSEVKPDSPAAAAGLRPNDVIVRFGDAEIRSVDDLARAIEAQKPSEAVEVIYRRDDREYRTEVTLKPFW